MLEHFFKLRENNTTWQREVSGGLTTFMTMAYIIFVQPVVMNAAGMDLESAMVATCLASAIATFAMGFLANYPLALAPGMGHNFNKPKQYRIMVTCFGALTVRKTCRSTSSLPLSAK